jgi:polyribonucleotide nucleotidyltransferase
MSYPTYGSTYTKEIKVGDKVIKIEIGKFSEQAAAAVLATCGETVVHTTVALGRKVDLGYFPLSVEFAEKLFAGGIIKGSRWVKRDGRPTDEAVLKARVIDRTMRPLFPDGLTNEVKIVNTVFSFDKENDPDVIGLIATAVGLAISPIPFDGPVAGLRIGFNKADGKFIVNPSNTERSTSDLDLILSGTGKSIVMLEAGANEVSEATMLEALDLAQKEFASICQDIEEIAKAVGKEKLSLVAEPSAEEAKKNEEIRAKISQKFTAEIHTAVEKEGRLQPAGLDELTVKVSEFINGDKTATDEDYLSNGAISSIIHELMKAEARRMILEEGMRPDGRKTDEIRPIWCEVDVFPRTHGSAMFKRGATQAVTVTTLGSPSLGQYIEDMEGQEIRHYMHHYNMPPFASGEAGRISSPKRREIGHGALAERALLPMIPSQEAFPYTIHVVSEILSSNGSTSQASVCGSTLSLMAAGVPIKRPVAGIAMGLMSDGKNYVVLSDIQGMEDHVGDMDFKVAGTEEGITAIQMDIKLKGIPREVMIKALDQAKIGRLHIMGKMMAVIDTPRVQLSQYAPKIEQITIPQDRIGELIGPGGKMIKSIIESTGAEIDVEEDVERKVGLVNVSSPDQEKITKAVTFIKSMMTEVEVDQEYDGTVTRVESYGAFVNFLPNKEGLIHVSQMSTEYVGDANDLAKVGDTVHVRVQEIKDDGKIGLSMLSKEDADARANRNGGGNGGGRDGGRGGDRGDRGGDRGGRPPFRGGSRFGGGGSRGGYSDRGDRGGNRSSDQPSRTPFRSRLLDEK